jgi:hypothetical protein
MDHYFITLINGGSPLRTIQRLKAKCDETLSDFAFNFNLRCYTVATTTLREAQAVYLAAQARPMTCKLPAVGGKDFRSRTWTRTNLVNYAATAGPGGLCRYMPDYFGIFGHFTCASLKK